MTLQELLGIRLPVIQAPMAGSQGSDLAIAVCNAGGLGSLPCAMLTPDGMRAELQAIRAATDRPFNVNFFCHAVPVADARREAAWRELLAPYFREYGIDPHEGAGGASREPVHCRGGRCAGAVQTRRGELSFWPAVRGSHGARNEMGRKGDRLGHDCREALWLEQRGVDAVIAQGAEAGGHRGIFLSQDLTTQIGTFALLPQIVKAVRVPVIAAGGIADAGGVAAAMSLGAAGVQVGTAYLLCPEAKTSAVHRAALKSARAPRTPP